MDDGEPTQLSSTTLVVIGVQDTNDNAPEFDQKTYNVEIPSNAKIDQKLFQVGFDVKNVCSVTGCFRWNLDGNQTFSESEKRFKFTGLGEKSCRSDFFAEFQFNKQQSAVPTM